MGGMLYQRRQQAAWRGRRDQAAGWNRTPTRRVHLRRAGCRRGGYHCATPMQYRWQSTPRRRRGELYSMAAGRGGQCRQEKRGKRKEERGEHRQEKRGEEERRAPRRRHPVLLLAVAERRRCPRQPACAGQSSSRPPRSRSESSTPSLNQSLRTPTVLSHSPPAPVAVMHTATHAVWFRACIRWLPCTPSTLRRHAIPALVTQSTQPGTSPQLLSSTARSPSPSWSL